MKPKDAMSRERAAELKKLLLKTVFVGIANTKQKKTAFAKFLGLTIDGVDSFIYEGRGSFETWTNAFLYRFDLSAKDLIERLPSLVDSIKNEAPLPRSEEIWRELKEALSEKELLISILTIKAALEQAPDSFRNSRKRTQ